MVRPVKIADFLTLEEVAEQLRVSPRTVKRMFKAGTIRPVRVGRRRLVTARELAAYVAHIEGRRLS